MKAVIATKYGPPDVLQLRDIPKPRPKDNEVLINIHAATVTAGDCEMRRFDMPLFLWLPLRIVMGIFKPRKKILGQELAGEIQAVGKNVTQFKKGDRVVAPTMFRMGAYAEYICLPAKYPIMVIPDNMTYEQAATIPTGGVNGLHFIKKVNIQPGEKVLINGAGGSIGTYAIQLAKSYGAEVIAVDSGEKTAMLQSIGADQVIDYQKEDFTQIGQTYDVIIDIVGKSNFSDCLKVLNTNGRYFLGNPTFTGMIRGAWVSRKTDKQVLFEFAGYKMEDMNFLRESIASGHLKVIIDRCYPLEKLAAAHEYVEKGRKKGNVVISIVETART